MQKLKKKMLELISLRTKNHSNISQDTTELHKTIKLSRFRNHFKIMVPKISDIH